MKELHVEIQFVKFPDCIGMLVEKYSGLFCLRMSESGKNVFVVATRMETRSLSFCSCQDSLEIHNQSTSKVSSMWPGMQ